MNLDEFKVALAAHARQQRTAAADVRQKIAFEKAAVTGHAKSIDDLARRQRTQAETDREVRRLEGVAAHCERRAKVAESGRLLLTNKEHGDPSYALTHSRLISAAVAFGVHQSE
jgi:hypothetical protein